MDIAPGDRLCANFITPPLYLGLCAEPEHYGLVWREVALNGKTRVLVRNLFPFLSHQSQNQFATFVVTK
jgi:hypothetical protein